MAEPARRMSFAQQRHERLLELLRAYGSVVVSKVAPELKVSELTIRRDINTLAARGLVTRVHGGAVLKDTTDESAGSPDSDQPTPARFTLGMITPALDYYWPLVIAGARAGCAAAHSRLVLRGASYDFKDIQRQVRILIDKTGVDGLLVPPTMDLPESEAFLRWLDGLPVPVVLVDRRPPDDLHFLSLEWVTSDHAAGATLAVNHLRSRGHRRIGLVVGAATDEAGETQSTGQIRRGWRDACGESDLDAGLLDRHIGGVTHPDRDARIDSVLADCRRTGTTALILHPDRLTIPFVQHCAESGVAIGDELAIVSYDDELAAVAEPPITAVRPPKQHVGRMAVELLTARLAEGLQRPPHRVSICPTLHIRASSTAPARAGRLI